MPQAQHLQPESLQMCYGSLVSCMPFGVMPGGVTPEQSAGWHSWPHTKAWGPLLPQLD